MIEFNFSDFERMAKRTGGVIDQVPFALANAMNSAAFRTRELLVSDTWPNAVEVRNRNFLRNALRVEKARKASLEVAIASTGPAGRNVNLAAHAKGGTKAARGRHLAIPPKGTVKRGVHGVAKGQRPRALIDKTPKRALRITEKGIFVGAGGRLHLRYAFKTAVRIRADVPFHQDFERYMRSEMPRAFEVSMKKAMATRRG